MQSEHTQKVRGVIRAHNRKDIKSERAIGAHKETLLRVFAYSIYSYDYCSRHVSSSDPLSNMLINTVINRRVLMLKWTWPGLGRAKKKKKSTEKGTASRVQGLDTLLSILFPL